MSYQAGTSRVWNARERRDYQIRLRNAIEGAREEAERALAESRLIVPVDETSVACQMFNLDDFVISR